MRYAVLRCARARTQRSCPKVCSPEEENGTDFKMSVSGYTFHDFTSFAKIGVLEHLNTFVNNVKYSVTEVEDVI
jgi:hypothetical protein